jgi:hypothetical protein
LCDRIIAGEPVVVLLLGCITQSLQECFRWQRKSLFAELGVAAGILPAVEPGVSPGGMDVRLGIRLEASSAGTGGKMPPSTAGRMPATTCSDVPE